MDVSNTGRIALLCVSLAPVFAASVNNPDGPPLVREARNGNLAAVRALIAQHADVNVASEDGTTSLHWAARADDLELTKALLAAGANPKTANRYGITPLFLAAKSGNASTTAVLLKAGADPKAALAEGENVLMAAARTGNPEVVKLLLEKGADPNVREKRFGETALMWAAGENNAAAIRELVSHGAEVNVVSDALQLAPWKWETSGMVSTMLPRGKWSALMIAARQGSREAAAALVEAKADMNLRDPDGATALVLAIINGHFDLASALVNKGADPNIADESGEAALYAAVDMNTLAEMLVRPAPKLTDELDGMGLAKILLQHGANPNARLKKPILGRQYEQGDASLGAGSTPFMRAVKSNDIPMMHLLLDSGADPLATQDDFSTPVMIAAFGGRRPGAVAGPYPVTEESAIEVMKICLSKGVDINAFNTNGQTAVHLAAGRGANKIVQFLADHGAKLDSKDKQNHTPAELAALPNRDRPTRLPGAPQDATVALLQQLISGKSVSSTQVGSTQ